MAIFSNMPPLRLLTKLYAPAGHRLAKRPDSPAYVYTPPPTSYWGGWGGYRSSPFEWHDEGEGGRWRNPLVIAQSRKREVPGGNLRKHEYQFFFGSPDSDHTGSTCRVCKLFCRNEQERRGHLTSCGCSKDIIVATRKFGSSERSKNLCACGCAGATLKECWGLNFHRIDCIEDYAHDAMEGMSFVLGEFIKEARMARLGVEISHV